MNGYEIVFILDPNVGEDSHKEIVDKAKAAIADKGGNVLHEFNWGRRKLAYRVKKREFGNYHFLYTDRVPAAIQEVESQFRYNENVIKWFTVAVDDVDFEHTAFEKLRTEGSLAKQISDRGR